MEQPYDNRAADLWLNEEEWGLVGFLAKHYAGDEEEYLDNLQEACIVLDGQEARIGLMFDARSRSTYIFTVVKNRLINVGEYKHQRLKKGEHYEEELHGQIDPEDLSFKSRVRVLLSSMSEEEHRVLSAVLDTEGLYQAARQIRMEYELFFEMLETIRDKARALGLDPQEGLLT